ncbi:hypothetical protein [Novosphingobium sp. BW1]|uniref:hypothetical protein n=1 Tax=Novosphingobium sp. BW1 TaxID=2592621 RepID=UPI0011DEB3F7|nr:hypothetical protein [Novosphingobium sp. BW1]TYC90754.1 hypothetical protein FMM79_05665 [Novosphingobium sp. BW1]
MKPFATTLAFALSCTAISVPASAQDTSAPTIAAVEPERLAIAERIVAVSLPPAEREEKMHEMLQAVTGQITAAIPLDDVEDEGLRAILREYLADIPEALRPTVSAFLPKQMNAMTHAYARLFTKAELEDTLAFARRPSGSAFLSKSIDIMSDPEVAAANTGYMRDVMALNQEMAGNLQARIAQYMAKNTDAMSRP